jgi:hypothetical protein
MPTKTIFISAANFKKLETIAAETNQTLSKVINSLIEGKPTAPKETQPTEQPQIEAPKVNVSSLSIAQIMKQKRTK